jgi:aspartate aminotransferase
MPEESDTMALELSRRISRIAPSPTLASDAKTKALIASGVDIVNLTAGEPDFPPPHAASLAGIKAITDNLSKYTPPSGLPELRKGIAAKLLAENGLSYSPDEIVVSAGGKHSLYNVFMAILDPGDEVILPAPYWVSYPEQIRLCDAEPVILATDERTGFQITPDQLERAITPRTKAVVLNSPSNPTGATYSPVELAALGAVLERHELYIVSDEIYERLTYDVRPVSIASLSRALYERTFTVNGFSKTYSMTGWRIGYVAAPKPLAQAMGSFQSHTTSNASNISQRAAFGALGTFDRAIVDEYRRRRDFVLGRLQELPGLTCAKPEGAFYLFPNARAWVGRTMVKEDGTAAVIGSVDELCDLLLTEARVSVVAGGGFGAPDNFRISYATSMEQLEKAMERLAAFAGRLA